MSDRFGNIPIQSPESSPPEKKHLKKADKTPGATKTKGKRPSLSRAWGWLAAAVIIIACYTTLGFWGVPYYISKIFPEKFQDKTGMVLEPTTVTFNPFTFQFETGAMRILSESGTPILSLQALHADVAPVAILRLDMVCNGVTISDFDLNIARELDGSYNFQQIFGDKKDSTPSEILDISNLPFLFSLNNISFVNGKITFNDIPAGKVHTVEEIQLNLPTFSNIPFQTDRYLRPHFSAVVNGSPIELTGQARMGESGGDDQLTRLSLDIHELDLTIYAGYLPFSLPMEFKKGTADGKIELFFDPQNKNTDKLSIAFQLMISGAELAKEQDSIVVAIPTARLSGNLQPVSKTLHLTEIAIKGPSISSFENSLLTNIRQTGKEKKQQPAPDSVKIAPYSIIIDQLLADDGRVRFFPGKKNQQATSTWAALQLSIKNYRSIPADINNKNGGSFSLSGEKAGSSTNFSWQGTFSSNDDLTGSLILENFEGNKLFETISSDFPFKLKGIADLKGQLTLYSKKESPPSLHYKLVDGKISIEDFALLDKEKRVLAASIVKLAPVNLTGESINFGNAQFEKGTALFTYGKVPEPFTAFNSDKYRLQGIDFAGKVIFNSLKKSGPQLSFNNVLLKANALDSSPKKPDNLSVSGKNETGGIFRAKGKVTLSPFSTTLNAGFRELPVQKVLPFFSTSPSLADIKGKLSGKGLLKLPAKTFTGELQLTKVAQKGSGRNTFSWKKSVFHNLNYTAKPFHLGIDSAQIDQARFFWSITKVDNGPMQYLTDFFKNYSPSSNKRSPGKPGTSSSPVEIKEISFSNSKINIHDRRLSPNWKAVVNDFAGTIKAIHPTPATDKSVFSFTGKLDDSPFTLSGEMNPFMRNANGSFRFSLGSYPLASFHKQLSAKTEVDTSNGELKLTLDCTWQDQHYISSGNLSLMDLEPVAVTSDVALPLALLTQPDGTLQLNFNLSRTAPVGKTALLDELLTSFQRQVIKGSVSPFLLASGDFTDLIGNEFIEFRPGEFMLSETGRTVLARYAALLISHPHVGLVLSGGADKRVDRQAMKERLEIIEQQRVDRENEKLFALWQEKKLLYEKNLEEQQKISGPSGQFVEQDIPTDVLAGFTPIQPEPIVVDDTMLLELAEKRINILHQYFTTQLVLQPDRLSTITPQSVDGGSEQDGNSVTITLKAVN